MVTTAAVRAADRTLTVGVEEEFLLMNRADGELALLAPRLIDLLDDDHVKPEAMRYQLETVTCVCGCPEEAGGQLRTLRRRAARAAAENGCHLVASGAAPGRMPGAYAVTPDPRYRELARRFGALLACTGTCGCHVHVGMPSRELGVQVLTRVRPWLATLLAVSANSPIANGRDTGWQSKRYRRWARWPSAMAPRAWRTAGDYDAAVSRLIRRGHAIDERGVYFHARLSCRYPTIELRIMDACLSVDDTVLVTSLARAIVGLAVAELRADVPIRRIGDVRIAAALNAAAHHGLAAPTRHPYTGRVVNHERMLETLLDRIPDADLIEGLLRRARERGTGAARQRVLWAAAETPQEFARLLAEATVS
ncbi:YbdK family carboxylate-amine ligase [Nonomuraea sp. SMC257]|uniref:Putative glutamate--cysteine ligase 2 n=1 Tax=Nonomuraea montanisoli TaxID=2741721 RepID=A0A7Y6M8D5_9ACTN|nr:YbdK family carboxylate-amine ligase [Nonomuraea montanisoli]NUW37655.1 YbdK family carboxylate-amine ligase [Nonomuraea montanisoli]